MNPRPLILATATLAVGTLAGCGDDDPEVTQIPTTPALTSPQVDAPATTAGGDGGSGATSPGRADRPTSPARSDAPLSKLIDDRSELATLGTALGAADPAVDLAGKREYTVFAPNNDAFTKLGTRLDMLLQTSASGQLKDVLEYHVVEGTYRTSALKDGQLLKTVNGTRLRVRVRGRQVSIRNANGSASFVEQDVDAANGVLHVIDAVMQPRD